MLKFIFLKASPSLCTGTWLEARPESTYCASSNIETKRRRRLRFRPPNEHVFLTPTPKSGGKVEGIRRATPLISMAELPGSFGKSRRISPISRAIDQRRERVWMELVWIEEEEDGGGGRDKLPKTFLALPPSSPRPPTQPIAHPPPLSPHRRTKSPPRLRPPEKKVFRLSLVSVLRPLPLSLHSSHGRAAEEARRRILRFVRSSVVRETGHVP